MFPIPPLTRGPARGEATKEDVMKLASDSEARICGTVWSVLGLSGTLLGLVAPACWSQEGDRSPLPEGNGKEIVERVCSQCHGIGLFRGRGEAKEGWDWTVHRMMGYGAPLKKEEVQVAIDYLAFAIPGPARPIGKVIPGSVEATIKEWDTPTRGERVRDPLVAPDGYIYYAGQFKDKVGQFDPKTGKIKEWSLRPGAGPHGLGADYEGNIWFHGAERGLSGQDPISLEDGAYHGVSDAHPPRDSSHAFVRPAKDDSFLHARNGEQFRPI